jgi:hypothetical protein
MTDPQIKFPRFIERESRKAELRHKKMVKRYRKAMVKGLRDIATGKHQTPLGIATWID